MPKRPRSHIIEALARANLHQAFAECGWTTEDVHADYGEDIFVRIFDKEVATPWSFFVQSKATDHIERYLVRDGREISFPIKPGHLKHWGRFWEPVVFTVFDAQAEITYWEVIQSCLESSKGEPKPTASIQIPLDNMLDKEGLLRIRNRTRRRFERFDGHTIGASILLEELQTQWGVEICYGPENGVLMLPKGRFQPDPDGERTLIVFGDLHTTVERSVRELGIALEQILDYSLDRMDQLILAFEEGRCLQIRDEDGKTIREIRTMDEFLRHTRRAAELKDG